MWPSISDDRPRIGRSTDVATVGSGTVGNVFPRARSFASVALLCAASVVGIACADGPAAGAADGSSRAAAPVDPSAGESNGPTGPSPPAPPRPTLPARLRLLGGDEYRATVRALLRLEASSSLEHVHLAGGFDTGADGQLQESLFVALFDEAERLAERAVATTLPEDFACIGPSVDVPCVRAVVRSLVPRAARRPVADERIEELVSFFAVHRAVVDDDRAALAGVVARLLVSPEFLYRSEVGVVDGDRRRLGPYEQADLLGYALTGAAPDDSLVAVAAAAGGGLTEATLRREARRLLATPAGQARVAAFVRQWMRATALDDMVRRPADFPKLASAEQGRALKDGFDAFVTAVAFSDDGTLAALLQSPFALVNRHSAPLVGAAVEGDALVRVNLPPAERRGLLTQPGLLAAHGASGDVDKDRPVLRGLLVKTQLLCESVGPPSGVNTAAAADAAAAIPGFAAMTTREQYEAMMEQSPACSACHAQFMPLGFAFGRYDALGHHRTEQRGRPIDPALDDVPLLGSLRDVEDGLALTDLLAAAPAVDDCFARHAAAFVTGLGSSPAAVALGRSVAHARSGPAWVLATLEDAVVHAALAPRILDDDEAVEDGDPEDDEDDEDGDAAAAPLVLLLSSGTELRPDETRSAHERAFSFAYQRDGNLVLYERGVARWASRTDGQRAHLAAMQGDGNLVVYARPGEPVFHTGTHGNPGAALYLHATGVLEVRAVDGTILATLAPNLGAP